MKLNDSGSLIVEALLIIIPLSVSFLLVLEVLRREIFQVVLAHTACSEVRDLSLGLNKNDAKKNLKRFLDKSVGKLHAENLLRFSRRDSFYLNGGIDTRRLDLGANSGFVLEYNYRYPQFIPLKVSGRKKHHSEVLQRCLFPF